MYKLSQETAMDGESGMGQVVCDSPGQDLVISGCKLGRNERGWREGGAAKT